MMMWRSSSILLILVLSLPSLFLAHSSSPTSDFLPLFSTHNTTTTTTFPPPSLQLLHTSLSTLLPLLPLLAPPPSHTLLLTLVTPAFKPLLFNWMCWLKYRVRWGQGTAATDDFNRAGASGGEGGEGGEGGGGGLPSFLIVTSDEPLARELVELGQIVWWLKAGSIEEEVVLRGNKEEKNKNQKKEAEEGNDLFSSLRALDLLLSPGSESKHDPRQQMLPWGSLHYQSLMLERTLVMSVLVGALAESQRVTVVERKKKAIEWRKRVMAHDWQKSRIYPEPFVGVKGVLVVDNDAVWLSSPVAHLTHPYRPTGTHPSFIFAPDMDPSSENAWAGHGMPCACFFYSRTSDEDSFTASDIVIESNDSTGEDEDEEIEYSPSTGAATTWRQIALCHIAMLLQSLKSGRNAARFYSTSNGELGGLKKAVAPSFQATSLGPAMYLAAQGTFALPKVSHQQWMTAIGAQDGEALLDLLWDAGIDEDVGTTCLALAKMNPHVCRIPTLATLFTTSAVSSSRSKPQQPPLRAEPLPLPFFPPGFSFFAHDQEFGTRPCVVHANYVTGSEKENLLRKENLWALSEEDGMMCDMRVIRNGGEGMI